MEATDANAAERWKMVEIRGDERADDRLDAPRPFEQWAMVELMGRRIVFGRVTETQMFGAGMMRIDVPDGEEFKTFYYSPAALYCITPVTEELARAGAASNPVRPIGLYDLALPAPASTSQFSFDEDDEFPYSARDALL